MIRFIIIILFFGLFFWLCNFKILLWSRDWPVILIFFGVLNLLTQKKDKKKRIIEDLKKGKITAPEAIARLEKIK